MKCLLKQKMSRDCINDLESDRMGSYQQQVEGLTPPHQYVSLSEEEESIKQTRASRILFWSLMILCGGIAIVFVSTKSSIFDQSTLHSSDASTDSSDTLFSISNEAYGSFDSSTNAYPFLEGSQLIEPHRMSTLSLKAPSDNCEYTLTHNASFGVEITPLTSSSWHVTALGVGQFDIEISSSCDEEQTLSGSVWSRYVRRELSTLTDDDREDFLDAMYTLFSVSTSDGKELYGANYISAAYLATVHVDASSNPVCDEFHPFSGFLNAHLYLSAYLEQALQAVNPRLCLHFMEYAPQYSSDAYSISHNSYQLDGGAWNPYLSDLYFGANDPLTGRIVDSRWENLTVPFMNEAFFAREMIDTDYTFFSAEEEEWLAAVEGNDEDEEEEDSVFNFVNAVSPAHFSSPFGLMRPPWNYNPSVYMTRFTNEVGIESFAAIPSEDSAVLSYFTGSTCDDYLSFVNTFTTSTAKEQLSFDDVVRKVGQYLHGHLHENIGGQGGSHARSVDDSLRQEHGFSDTDILVVAERSHFFVKEQSSALVCSPITAETLQTYFNSDMTLNNVANAEIVAAVGSEASGVSCTCDDSYFSSSSGLSDLVSLFFGAKYMNLKNGYPQSATPYKILTMSTEEQTEVLKLLCSRNPLDGDFVGSSSAWDPIFWVAHPAMERVLHRLQFAAAAAPEAFFPVSFNFSSIDATCSGHSADGTLDWLQGFNLAGSGAEAHELSNAELTALLNPLGDLFSSRLSYVYDSSGGIGCSDVDQLLQL